MDDLFGFDAAQIARIAAAVRAFEGGNSDPNAARLQRADLHAIPFLNNNEGTVPPYAVMRVIDSEEDPEDDPAIVDQFTFLLCDQPDGTFNQLYLVNGSDEVEPSATGWGTWMWHAGRVLYDDGDTPARGEMWGATDGEWFLSKDRPGFYIAGGIDETLTTILAVQKLVDSALCRPNADIAAGDSGTVTIYGGTPGSETSTSLEVADCYNVSSVDLIETDLCQVAWPHGKPYVVKIC